MEPYEALTVEVSVPRIPHLHFQLRRSSHQKKALSDTRRPSISIDILYLLLSRGSTFNMLNVAQRVPT